MSRSSLVLLLVLNFGSESYAQRSGRGSSRSSGGSVSVRGHFRRDGTYVQPHRRTAPDASYYNNWSTFGNVNPYTGSFGTKLVPPLRNGLGTSSTGSSGLPLPSLNYSTPPTRLATPSVEVWPVPTAASAAGWTLGPSDYQIQQKARDVERAAFWVQRGFRFDPDTMSAYQMDAKARDFERALFWKQQGYAFDPDWMSAYQMDNKVRDIQRARYWKEQGYDFNPDWMSAYQMDNKVRDVQRARYWKEQGYDFNPDWMSAYQMDNKVQDVQRARYWKEQGYDFNPDWMSAYQMDNKVRDIQRARYWKERGFDFDPNGLSGYQMDLRVREFQAGGRR